MAGIEINPEDLKKFFKRIASPTSEEGKLVIGRALYETGNFILNEAKKITPVEHGTLRRSGLVWAPEEGPDGLEVTIGFGDAACDYAVFVHENLNAYHAPPTSAKFLEIPMVQHSGMARTAVTEKVMALLAGAG